MVTNNFSNEFYDDEYFEQFPIIEEIPENPEKELVNDFIGKLKESARNEIKEELDDKDKTIDHLNKSIDRKNQEIKELSNKVKERENSDKNTAFGNLIISKIKSSFASMPDKEPYSLVLKVKSILELMFIKKEYDAFDKESPNEAPIWLMSVVTYYDNINEVLDILEILGVSFPKEARNINLPLFWDNSELDEFLDTIQNHYVCNGCIYSGNLRFWQSNSLRSAYKQCHTKYSEIPWQLILRNYNWHNFERLEKIGKMMFTRMHANYFARMFTEYQEWSEDEIKTVIKNMDISKYKFNESEVNGFILKYIEYFNDTDKKAIIKYYNRAYEKLPFEYHKYYFKTVENLNYMLEKIKNYPEEEARELLEIYFERKREFDEKKRELESK